MKLAADTQPYLDGSQFASTLRTRLQITPDDARVMTRREMLTDYVRGKQVIHVGCVDHDVASITHKIARDHWLHKLLNDEADRCLGLDINETGIAYIRDELGFEDVETVDIFERPSELAMAQSWDAMILAEVVEHFDDPVSYLRKIHAFYGEKVGELVVTVPNAFKERNFQGAKRHVEAINSDHRYWFTPYTISKVLVMAGFTVDDIIMTVRKRYGLVRGLRQRRYPLLRNGITVIAKFQG